MTHWNAESQPPDDPEGVPVPIRVIVHPPLAKGGRRVRVDGEILGLAHSAADVAEFLRRAGLDIDPAELAGQPWIDWRGVGAERWGPETGN
ncbi:hypothetical protein ACFWOB_05760 [Streptomyces sp. NPDC058420]|jgi:hypothetical protein|uniref:hypothetical protein n=1 Tax=Streptomyces sp. NPDC058420 TaxID=3346489 RepID=UPI003654C5FC